MIALLLYVWNSIFLEKYRLFIKTLFKKYHFNGFRKSAFQKHFQRLSTIIREEDLCVSAQYLAWTKNWILFMGTVRMRNTAEQEPRLRTRFLDMFLTKI